jgi:CBS domain-containing protein
MILTNCQKNICAHFWFSSFSAGGFCKLQVASSTCIHFDCDTGPYNCFKKLLYHFAGTGDLKISLMEKLVNILSRKQTHFHTIGTATTVGDALCQMNCENVDYLVVTDESDRFRGIISEHDITTSMMAADKPIHLTPVHEVMNNRLPYLSSNDSVEDCMRLMQQHKVRYVLVFDGLTFKGVISSDDLLYELAYKERLLEEV